MVWPGVNWHSHTWHEIASPLSLDNTKTTENTSQQIRAVVYDKVVGLLWKVEGTIILSWSDFWKVLGMMTIIGFTWGKADIKSICSVSSFHVLTYNIWAKLFEEKCDACNGFNDQQIQQCCVFFLLWKMNISNALSTVTIFFFSVIFWAFHAFIKTEDSG